MNIPSGSPLTSECPFAQTERPDTQETVGIATAEVLGVVLAGGLSSRMGREKARIRVYGESKPDLLTRTYQLLEDLLDDVRVACRPGRPREGYNCIFDIVEGLGPFGGVHAALHVARQTGRQAVLALSCDLPFMDRPTLRRLLLARQERAASALLTTFRQRETGFIEALTAVYEVKALPLFEQALRAGERKLSRIVDPAQRTDIPYARHESLPFFNINYPADLEVAHRLLAAL